MRRVRWDSSSILRMVRRSRPSRLSFRRVAAWVLAIAFGSASTTFGAAADALRHLDQAEFILSDAPEPPANSAAWQQQTLPDDWSASRPGIWGSGWYRLHFDVPGEPGLFATYLFVLQTAGAVYVNGVQVGQSGALEETPETRTPASDVIPGRGFFAHTPLLFSIRPSLLHPGRNTLDVQLWVKPGAAGAVSGITIGPEPAVRALYERGLFIAVIGPQMIVVFSAGFGLFILLLWLRRPHESMYGYFALTALTFALFIAGRFVITEPPVPFPYWGVLVWIALEAYIVFMCLFALRYAGWHWPRLELCLWAYLAVSPFLHYASFVGEGGWIAGHWWLMTFVMTLVYVAMFWTIAAQRRTLETLGLALAGSVKLIVSANERLLPYPIDLPRYQPFAYVPMFMMIGWILIDRFVKSLNETQKLNAELEQRVALKHAELEQSYRRMQRMERQQAIVEERSRIMRDMHDGIGAQLISTLSLVERGESSEAEVAAALRECLDDLRLTIDSLEPTENDLLPVMGNLRYRLDERLRKQGIDLDWRVKEVPGLSCLTPQNVLHILRILQEAFTNILKHAHATNIQVETGLDQAGKHVYIQVRDNGAGFSGERTGRGIPSMRHRATIIGGRLEIEPSGAGTTLNLLLPVS